MPRIVVLDGYTLNPGDNPWDPVAALGDLTVHDRTPPELILPRSQGAPILLTNKTPITGQTIAALPELRMISVLATGYDIVDLPAARERRIPVCNVPEYGTATVAQFTFAMILELCHRIGAHDQSVKGGQWQQNPDWCYWNSPQVELAGKTLGIVGFGRIGRRVAQIAHAMGMRVIAFDPAAGPPPPYQPFAWMSLDGVAAQADIITLHCPQTAENIRFVNARLLARMKPSAFLINVARGGLICEPDLADALNRGTIAGAAVDVVSAEPIRPDNPLLHARNCIITPHMAWAALESRRRIMAETARNISAWLAGQPVNVVNF